MRKKLENILFFPLLKAAPVVEATAAMGYCTEDGVYVGKRRIAHNATPSSSKPSTVTSTPTTVTTAKKNGKNYKPKLFSHYLHVDKNLSWR